ncbi:MAG: hypothetical protein NTY20_06170 [Candidatus Aenigmarchaeota archaeon]|nr:hypothetical protein [Candidatus Aenigmarchaeota archaeon]
MEKTEYRSCRRCGKPLSVYNPEKDCFHHSVDPDERNLPENWQVIGSFAGRGARVVQKQYEGRLEK